MDIGSFQFATQLKQLYLGWAFTFYGFINCYVLVHVLLVRCMKPKAPTVVSPIATEQRSPSIADIRSEAGHKALIQRVEVSIRARISQSVGTGSFLILEVLFTTCLAVYAFYLTLFVMVDSTVKMVLVSAFFISTVHLIEVCSSPIREGIRFVHQIELQTTNDTSTSSLWKRYQNWHRKHLDVKSEGKYSELILIANEIVEIVLQV